MNNTMTGDKPISQSEKAKDTETMIDYVAKQLFGLRDCQNPDDLIWTEICETETKLIRLYKKILILKETLSKNQIPYDFPKSDKWFRIVGMKETSIEILMQNQFLLSNLLKMSDVAIRAEMQDLYLPSVDVELLITALNNLKLNRDIAEDQSLHWSSMSQLKKSPKPRHHSYTSSSSSPSDHFISASSLSPQFHDDDSNSSHRKENYGYTPPLTPQYKIIKGKFPATPPPKKKNKLHVDSFQPLTKSKSHESQLSFKINVDSQRSSKKSLISIEGYNGGHSITDTSIKHFGGDSAFKPLASGHSSPLPSHHNKSASDSLSSPSPHNTIMKHTIKHKFTNKISMKTCEYCHKPVFRGRFCRYCKLTFHKDCALKAIPTCGLPDGYLNYYIEQQNIKGDNSPDSSKQRDHLHLPDSSSNASSRSSSSPPSPHGSSIYSDNQFQYPDSLINPSDYLNLSNPVVSISTTDVTGTVTSNDSDRSDKTIIDTLGSSSSGDPNSNMERVDSVEIGDEESSQLRRDNSLTVALREWEIPFDELIFGDEIGHGQFGKVFRGNWHGDVAVKVINMDPNMDNQIQLQAFKAEVTMLKKTRHDNLVLFMGACMNPPSLAIVTSFVRGTTLYYKIHEKRERYLLHQIVTIATQIVQGLGYLHAKNIVHKDLKTKNIFVENLKSSAASGDYFKVIITDFGILSMTRLCCSRRNNNYTLHVPKGWIYYLSPEIVKLLRPFSDSYDDDLAFSKYSDIYAFGTVWYELICGEWPYTNYPLECIIWKIGNGVKFPVNVQCSQEFKDLLIQCWAYNPNDRPTCQSILKNLEKLPRKRLARSPSHPVQLSRSVENLL